MTRLHYRRLGQSGPTIVLLHGLFGQGRNWTSIAKALSGQAVVLLPDLANHGQSPWTQEFGYPEMAASVAKLLAAESKTGAATVVGHSMGGKVAMVLTLNHPELVEKLCVVDVSPVRYDSLSSFADYVKAMRSLGLSALPDRAAADAGLQDLVPEATIRSFLLQNLRRMHEPTGGPRWRWQMNLELLGDHLAELGDWPPVTAPAYQGPVLWIAGEKSRYVRPEFAAPMRQLFPRTQLVTVKGAGHWVHADRPEVFLAALRRFALEERSMSG